MRGGTVDHGWQFINYRFNDYCSALNESITSCPVQLPMWVPSVYISVLPDSCLIFNLTF